LFTPGEEGDGEEGDDVPQDVVHVRVDPSITLIPARAFYQRKQLTEVKLCEGLVEIGYCAFAGCGYLITKLVIPNSLRRINDGAFNSSLQCPIRLHDGIERIGGGTFGGCIFTNFIVPPLITVIPNWMLNNCKSSFSNEIPLTVTWIGSDAFYSTHCLRNVAFPPDADVEDDNFRDAMDLLQLFGSIAEIIRNLKNPFDGLRVHSTVYYQTYNQGVLQRLIFLRHA
jgi:hypothetical protein